MPLYDYRCPSTGHVRESLQPMWADRMFCIECLEEAERVAANRVAVTSPEVDTRGKFRRFQEATAELDYAASKVEQSTGQAVTTPNYWSMAKRRAHDMIAHGEAPAAVRNGVTQ